MAAIRNMPKVIEFLGYDPRPAPLGMAARLRHQRETLGLSQVAAAERLGIDPATLRRWERGEKEPVGRFLMKVSEFLDQHDAGQAARTKDA